ncbi:hypothetical protein DN069_30825 [Streptacidiphilus pinicola]|uniref:Uncharacterized protein n=1 Tax=Streptacidiphilus pinicola TaxID=2219663 RepID=A0A2X0IEJ2_9ACTN|nr:hypothetical protein [Streptacidiphilus pinicola]RAG81851.1 hypothetical protein DN069_30825 [Streptacidiphilus pinicola]
MSTDRHGDDAVDKLFRAARAGFVQRADASFDFAAGFADVVDRARLTRPSADALCAQADRLASVLGLLTPGAAGLAHEQVRRARELVFAFRATVSSSAAPRPEGLAALLDQVADHLDAADRLVRAHGGTTLAHAVQETVRDLGPVAVDPSAELATLRGLTRAAFSDAPPSGRTAHRPAARRDRAVGENRDA